MSDFYTLMGLLVYSWLEIMEFSQFSILLFLALEYGCITKAVKFQ